MIFSTFYLLYEIHTVDFSIIFSKRKATIVHNKFASEREISFYFFLSNVNYCLARMAARLPVTAWKPVLMVCTEHLMKKTNMFDFQN